MTDHGNDGEPDLWANTGNLPPVPPVPPTNPGSERPAWLIPGAIALGLGALAALAIFLIIKSGDDDTISTDASTTTTTAPGTTLAPETTVASETTIAPETTVTPPTTIASETTIAPETTVTPETTAPPTSAAPTTAPPTGTAPAAPGTALVAGTVYDIVHACTTSPVPGYQVTSYVAVADFGPLVIEQGIDEGNAFGLYSEAGIPIDTGEYTDLGDDGFAMLAFEGGGSFEVAANPSGISPVECASLGTVRLSDPAAPQFGYTHGIVDLCSTNAPFRALGYLSEGGTIGIVDNGDGTAQVTFDSANLFSATDPAAAITAGERLQIDGEVTGSTIEGDTTQTISIDLDDTTQRSCSDSENP
ncbi:MAG: hypothetical protein P8P69_04870 [Ilumatobacter sp.]|nr:hypothetical protein [Ilumatobacter sp.]